MELLRKSSYDVEAVAETSFKSREDDDIVAFAERKNLVIITLDVGFGSIYYFSKRELVGIIIIRVHPPTVEDVNKVLLNFLSRVDLDKKKLTKNLIVLNRKRYRVLK